MKRSLLLFPALLLSGLLTGCCLFKEDGPPPVTPPYTLPDSSPEKITDSLLKEKMVDLLSMGMVTNGLAGRSIRKIQAHRGNREMELLASVAEKLAATGLITLSNSPKAPFFRSKITPESWQVTLEQPFPRIVLLRRAISLKKK